MDKTFGLGRGEVGGNLGSVFAPMSVIIVYTVALDKNLWVLVRCC